MVLSSSCKYNCSCGGGCCLCTSGLIPILLDCGLSLSMHEIPSKDPVDCNRVMFVLYVHLKSHVGII